MLVWRFLSHQGENLVEYSDPIMPLRVSMYDATWFVSQK